MKKKMLHTFTAVYKKARGGYTVWIEEIPGVISEGKTKVQATANIKDALALMLETNRIMSFKDAVGNIERSPISLAVPETV
ncbi:MAG: type II toxin-antitoxin system HicB family antitoxin [bacterium]|nr:type II toxin-antitoxin system HicB family antitoxin [bacterium]